MKMTKLMPAVFLVVTSLAWADCDRRDRPSRYSTDCEWSTNNPVFFAQEVSFDGFATLSVGQSTINDLTGAHIHDNGRLGGGAGLNYFFTRHLGMDVEAYTENVNHFWVDDVSANFIVRFPFDVIRLAPYIFAGGGRQFDPQERWFGEVGTGLDFRFGKRWGMFVDARYIEIENGNNKGLGRLGLRFVL